MTWNRSREGIQIKSKALCTGLILAAMLAAGCAGPPAGQSGAPAAPATDPAPQPSAPATEPAAAASGTRYVAVAEQSSAAYAVGETFLGRDLDAVAVGTTSAITGEIILNNGMIQPSVIQVDLSTLKSDEARRDRRVYSALDTANHPFATFRITGAEGSPTLHDGQETAFPLQGLMTIKGTEKPLVFAAKAHLIGDTLTLTAETTFPMTEFGVDPPSIAGFVSVKDEVTLKVTFVGKQQ